VPRSLLLGRRRVSVTEYEYDDEGRLIRSVTTHDPEWSEEDLGFAKAHRRREAERCPGCGLPLSETTDPDREGEYEAPPPTRCHACTPLEHRKSEYRESPPGLLFNVHLKPQKGR
jgi:YD repeat-containing protein